MLRSDVRALDRPSLIRAVRGLLFAAAATALLPACVTFGVTSNDDSAAGAVHRETVHSFLWGAVPGEVQYTACSVPGDADGNGVWQVRNNVHAGHIAASVLTLGIWTPMGVELTCAAARPGEIGIGGPECSNRAAADPGLRPSAPGCAPPSETPQVSPALLSSPGVTTGGAPPPGATGATPPEPPATSPSPPASAPVATPPGVPAAPVNVVLDCQEDATWHNFAHSVSATPKKLCRPRPPARLDAGERAAPLVALVREAEQKGQRIRAVGAGWSFSSAAVTDGILVDMRWFGGSLPLPEQEDWAPKTAGRSYGHFEAGAAVDAVNLALQNAGYSLFTMGGSAGQTWVGAVATGTHGGDTMYRAISDYLRALHVVTEGGERLWIERSSDPLSRGGYAKRIGARFIQDDETFEAAVAGLGTFGIVHSAVIEVQKLESYMLWRQRFDYDDELRHVMKTFDFSRFPWPDPMQQALSRKAVPQQGTSRTGALRHFEVVVNPYETGAGARGAFITTVWDDNRVIVPSAVTGNAGNVNTRVGTVMVRILEGKLAAEVPAALHILLPSQYAEITTPLEGPLRTLFPKGIPTGGVPMSMELAVDRRDVDDAMNVILKEIGDHSTGYYYPGVVAFRNSLGTGALIGFTRFGETTTIEFPTVSGVPGTEAFFGRVVLALTKAKLRFTQHPGQWNTYSKDPDLFRKDFGDRLTRFQAVRDKLLSATGRKTFANDYTDSIGLTTPIPAGAAAVARK